MKNALLRADPEDFSVVDLTFDSLRRFALLGDFHNTPEQYRFSPWFHPAADGKQEAPAMFVQQHKLFSGRHGFTVDVFGNLSYQRQFMMAGADFNNALLPSHPC